MPRLIDLITVSNKTQFKVIHPSGNVIHIDENYLVSTPILFSDGWELYVESLKLEVGKYYKNGAGHNCHAFGYSKHTPTRDKYYVYNISRDYNYQVNENGIYLKVNDTEHLSLKTEISEQEALTNPWQNK